MLHAVGIEYHAHQDEKTKFKVAGPWDLYFLGIQPIPVNFMHSICLYML